MLGVPTDGPTALFLESKLEIICLHHWWVPIVCKNTQLMILGINFSENFRGWRMLQGYWQNLLHISPPESFSTGRWHLPKHLPPFFFQIKQEAPESKQPQWRLALLTYWQFLKLGISVFWDIKNIFGKTKIYPLNIGILYLVISDQLGTVFEFIFEIHLEVPSIIAHSSMSVNINGYKKYFSLYLCLWGNGP